MGSLCPLMGMRNLLCASYVPLGCSIRFFKISFNLLWSVQADQLIAAIFLQEFNCEFFFIFLVILELRSEKFMVTDLIVA